MESPCISVCNLEHGLCKNCGRTREQIVSWTEYSDDERAAIMRKLEQRGYPKPDA